MDPKPITEKVALEKPEFRVLVVDDDLTAASLLQAWLRRGKLARYAVEMASSLREALERVGRGGLDLAILDCGLPDSQGPNTLSRFRAGAPELPVLVLTGWVDGAVEAEAARIGARACLAKSSVPFPQFEAIVLSALGLPTA